MVRVDWKLYLAMLAVMGLLFQMLVGPAVPGALPVYFTANNLRPLLVKLTYFALLVCPMVTIIGMVQAWQSGAYLNRLVRHQSFQYLLSVTCFKAFLRVISPVLLFALFNQLVVGQFYWQETTALMLAYAWLVGLYLLGELFFEPGTALLITCLWLLVAVLLSQPLAFLGPMAFQIQRPATTWQILTLVSLLFLLFFVMKIKLSKKDFYGEQ